MLVAFILCNECGEVEPEEAGALLLLDIAVECGEFIESSSKDAKIMKK